VHGDENYQMAVEASKILFSNKAGELLHQIDEKTFLDVFEGVPTFELSADKLSAGVPLLELLAAETNIFSSKGEARKMVQGGGVSLNKEKVSDPMMTVTTEALLNGKYILVQKGKKNYFLIIVR
jgi:tyrosyl-tRNA synthetase